MDFRAAGTEDADAISALIHCFAHEFLATPDGKGAERFFESVSVAAESEYIANPRYQYRVAFEDGVLAGFIAVRDRSHVFHLFVAHEFQRRSLATQLWQMAKTATTALGHIDAFTVNSSPFALPVYERFGFVKTGLQVEMHGICFVPMRLSPAPEK
jgi:ribosomal protein S18 acetylase RimI-like enzyme